MSDNLDVIWPAEEHTIAKHRILQAYLMAWMPILSHQSGALGQAGNPIRYIDGFAGPGIYRGGEKGSPLLALEAALNHSIAFPVPVDLTFIEEDRDRHRILNSLVEQYRPDIASSNKISGVRTIRGDCVAVINSMLDEVQSSRRRFGPAMVFLDQFGYSSVPMELVARILSQPQCEVFTFFFWRDLDRFISDPNKHSGLTRAFGSDDWRAAITMSGPQREDFVQETYSRSLKGIGNAKYVWHFAMADQGGKLLCWLFFCTNSLRGLEEMKRAMWRVDPSGGFYFSDKHGLDQLCLLTNYGDDRLESEMEAALAGRTMTVEEIAEWVLTETPHHSFKSVLAKLEKRKAVHPENPPKGRHSGSYSDPQMRMVFEFPMFGPRR